MRWVILSRACVMFVCALAAAAILFLTLFTLSPHAVAADQISASAAPSLHFCAAPAVLPSDTPISTYSPPICIAYDGLEAQKYTVKVFLLERQTGRYYCASSQWCGGDSKPQAVLALDNSAGDNSAGQVLEVRTMDVYKYSSYLWVADLYNEAGSKVAVAQLGAQGTNNRAPVLQPVGQLSAQECRPFSITLNATDVEHDPIIYTVQNLPSGATLDPSTGVFSWTCPTFGSTRILFRAVQTDASALEDSELVDLQVAAVPTPVPPTPTPPLISASAPLPPVASRDNTPTTALYVPSNSDAYGRAVDHLSHVMDKYNTQFDVYTDLASAGNHFVHRARIQTGQTGDPPVAIDDGYTPTVHSGATAIANVFTPTSQLAWGGWYFMVGMLEGDERLPKDNWGTYPNAGYDLSGAAAITFWARGARGGERVEFFAFNVGRDAYGNPLPGHLYPDSSVKYSTCGRMGSSCATTYTTLTDNWQQYTIPLTGADLRYVLGGFGWVTSAQQNSGQGITFFLDDISYDLPRLQQPRLLTSFETISSTVPFDTVQSNASFVYDDALALMAFVAGRQWERAQLVADALLYAQEHDRFYTDGRLRNAYQAGDLAVPPGWTPLGKAGSARPPGWWGQTAPGTDLQWIEDAKHVATDTGNMAWVALALLNYYEARGGQQYLDAVLRLAEWVQVNAFDERGAGGYTGGYLGAEPAQTKALWKSTEHNIDLAVLFERLWRLTNDERWHIRADDARAFVESMWDPTLCHYWTGTLPDGVTVNKQAIPLDGQTWALMAFGVSEHTQQAVRFAELNHKVTYQQDQTTSYTGYDFNEDRDQIWLEGTGQMAVSYKLLNQPSHAEEVLSEMRKIQDTAKQGNGKGLVAAPACCASTGFDWWYFDRLHVGATAWFIFGELGLNPYWPSQSFVLSVNNAGDGHGIVNINPPGIVCSDTCSASYEHGTLVTLTAVADSGSRFVAWSGGACSGNGICTVTMDAAKSVTATFELVTHTLTVGMDGDGKGRVTSQPFGIDCGSACSAIYKHGTIVTLTAMPAGSSRFVTWSGACSGHDTCTVTMDADKSVTATFDKVPGPSVTLTVNAFGVVHVLSLPLDQTSQGIDCTGVCSVLYASGTEVTLTTERGASLGTPIWWGECTVDTPCWARFSETHTFNITGTTSINVLPARLFLPVVHR